MAIFFYHKFSDFWRKGCTILLALSFLSGFLLGMFAYISAEDSLVLLMRGTFLSSVSIVSLLAVTCLPFLLSAFSVYISRPGFMLPVSFGKAFLFSFVSLGLYSCIHSAGRFLFWFLIFTDILSLPAIYFFWLRYLPGDRSISFPVITMYLSLIVLIGSLYFRFITPFWAHI